MATVVRSTSVTVVTADATRHTRELLMSCYGCDDAYKT
jgi:hypothetical protein